MEVDRQTNIEMRHWILTVRVRVEENNYKFFILDSMGRKSRHKRKQRIQKRLMSIDLAAKGDSWEVMDTRPQTEHECGIRKILRSSEGGGGSRQFGKEDKWRTVF